MWKVFRNPRHRPLIIACVLASFLIIFLYGFQLFHDYEIDIERAEVSAKNTSFILEQQIESTFENVNLSLLHIVDIIKERGPNFKWNYVEYYRFGQGNFLLHL